MRDRLLACREASTKYSKSRFDDDAAEAAYLAGFVEDCHVRKVGFQIEVSTTTTHPAMALLFRRLFERYGNVYQLAGFDHTFLYYRYYLATYLDPSFGTVLRKTGDLPEGVPRDIESPLLKEYLAAIVDAEGGIRLYDNGGRADSVLYITINKHALLTSLRGAIGGRLYSHERAWRLVLYGKKANQILEQISPRHEEKIIKSALVREATGKPWFQVEHEWDLVVANIHDNVAEFKERARTDYIQNHGRPHAKDSRED